MENRGNVKSAIFGGFPYFKDKSMAFLNDNLNSKR
jgi:hypothetical protein